METIRNYSDLIKQIPVYCQSTIVKKSVWGRFSIDDEIKEAIFGSNEKVEISRSDVFSERDTAKKIVMTLMWGYPTGGRGENIKNILLNINKLVEILSSEKDKNITEKEARKLFTKLKKIPGLGISTWTKFLYFFNVSIDSKTCQIYDLKIVDSLNKKQISELGLQEWKQNNRCYFDYIALVNNLATTMSVLPEQVEVFLFYFNLYYIFPVKSE